MSLRVYYEVLNQKGSPALFTDTLANRPAFGFQGRLFISTDTAQIFEDTGSAWTLIADATGSVIGFVPYSGAINDLNLGSFDITADIGIFNQVKAVGSGGLSINANSGTQVALFGAGGGANMTLYGSLTGTTASLTTSITDGLLVNHSGSRGIRVNSTGAGFGIIINNTTGATSAPFTIQQNGSTTIALNDNGSGVFNNSITASSLIRNGGTASQYLMADGSVTTLTNPITGTGTTNTLPKFTGASSLGNSNISDNGTEIALNSDTAIGTTTLASATKFTLGGTETAVSAISRGQLINTTLVASANGDRLVALDIAPTFTIGAFTGVEQIGLRLSGRIAATGAIDIYRNSNQSILYADNSETTLQNTTSTARIAFRIGGIDYGRFLPTTGNFTLQNGGTFTDAGFRLDVQGTARVTGAATFSSDLTWGASSGNYMYAGGSTHKILYSASGTNNFYSGGLNGFRVVNQADTTVLMSINDTGAATFSSTINATGIITTNASAGLVIQPTTTTDQGYLTVVNASGSIFFGMDNSAGSVLGNGAYSRFIYNTGAYPLDFYTNAIPRTRITSGGSLLVGTTTDNGQGILQLNGSLTAFGISVSGEVNTASATLSQQYYHVFTGASGQTLTLPSPASNNFQYVIINNTANTVTLAAATSTNIITTTNTSVASITLIANQRVLVIADGNNKYYQIF
jgi:hypothetical protein